MNTYIKIEKSNYLSFGKIRKKKISKVLEFDNWERTEWGFGKRRKVMHTEKWSGNIVRLRTSMWIRDGKLHPWWLFLGFRTTYVVYQVFRALFFVFIIYSLLFSHCVYLQCIFSRNINQIYEYVLFIKWIVFNDLFVFYIYIKCTMQFNYIF